MSTPQYIPTLDELEGTLDISDQTNLAVSVPITLTDDTIGFDLTDSTFLEAIDDQVNTLIQDGTGLAWTYDDGANTLTGNVSLSPFDTGDLSEGSNLYYTDERVDDRVSVLIQNGTGLAWTYDDGANTLTGNVSLSPFDTGDLSEGSNLYYTDERVDDRVAVLVQDGTGLAWTYDDGANTFTGNVSLSPFDTGDLAEGSNLYFTDERAQDAVGSILNDGATINFTYDDGANTITAETIDSAIDHDALLNFDSAEHFTAASLGFSGLTDNRLLRANGATALQDSGITVGDDDQITGVAGITIDNIDIDGTTIDSTSVLTLNSAASHLLNIGGSTEISVSANLMLFNDGGGTSGFGWSTPGQLDFLLAVSPEMYLTANNLTFNNGATDTGFGWSTNGVLDFVVGGSTEISYAANTMTFNSGSNDPVLDWSTDGQLDVSSGFFSIQNMDVLINLILNM